MQKVPWFLSDVLHAAHSEAWEIQEPSKEELRWWLEQVDQAGDMGGEEIWEEEELVGVKRKRPMK